MYVTECVIIRAWGKMRQKIGKCAVRYAIKKRDYALDYAMERTIIYQYQPENQVSIPNFHLTFIYFHQISAV